MCASSGHRRPRRLGNRCSRAWPASNTAGYDSAGVALITEEGIWRRAEAPTAPLRRRAREARRERPAVRRTGIGHTAGDPWPPDGRNAHPHLDCTGHLALVHNGIIENHTELAARARRACHCPDLGDRHRGGRPTDRREIDGGLGLARPSVRRSRRCAARSPSPPSIGTSNLDRRRSARLAAGGRPLRDETLLASDIPALLGRPARGHAR